MASKISMNLLRRILYLNAMIFRSKFVNFINEGLIQQQALENTKKKNNQINKQIHFMTFTLNYLLLNTFQIRLSALESIDSFFLYIIQTNQPFQQLSFDFSLHDYFISLYLSLLLLTCLIFLNQILNLSLSQFSQPCFTCFSSPLLQ
ncbi:hypothetical protein ABPG72_007070 [Tetrahymena utriculariae]